MDVKRMTKINKAHCFNTKMQNTDTDIQKETSILKT